MNAVPMSAGGTGATTAAGAAANVVNGNAIAPGAVAATGPIVGPAVNSIVNAAQMCTTPGTLDQSCIINSLGSGVDITVPPGTYNIGGLITLSQTGLTISCQPGAVLKKRYNGDIFQITGTNVTLDGCTLDGNQAGSYSGDDIGISGAANVTIKNSVIKNATNWGIDGGSNAGGGGVAVLLITGSVFTGNLFSPINLGGPSSDIMIANNPLIDASLGTSSSSGSGIIAHSGNASSISRLTVTGNTIHAGTQFCVEWGTFGTGAMIDSTVSGNTCISEADGDGGFSTLGLTGASSIAGNTVDINGKTDSIACFELIEDTGVSVTGNTCNANGGLVNEAFSVGSTSDSTFVGNTMSGIGVSGGDQRGYGFLVSDGLANSSDNLISDNNISFASGEGGVAIFLQSQSAFAISRNVIAQNHIYGTGTGTTIAIGFDTDSGTEDSNALSGNEVFNTSYGVIHGSDTNTVDRFNRCVSIGGGGCESGTAGSGLALMPWGIHGTSATTMQGSDGTGTYGHCPEYASDGSLTDSGAACNNAFSGGLGINYQDVAETAAPSDPAGGNDRLYLDSTSHLLTCLNSSGGSCMPSANGVSSINATTGAFTFTGTGVSCSGTTCTFTGNTGSGAVLAGSEYSPAYYNQTGSSATVGGVTPFTGLGYWQMNAPPSAATAAEIVSAIGSTAVANATASATATTATNFSGSLSGDVTGTQSATTVAKVNGGSIPVLSSANCTNTSGQIVACATTGSGSVVLATSPALSAPTVTGTLAGASETLSGTLSVTGAQTLTGTTTMKGNATMQSGTNASQTLTIQPGSSVDQIGAMQFNNYSGVAKWQIQKDTNNYLRVTDAANSLDRVIFPANANTTINAGAGANAVVINNTSGSGTSGFIVYEGGSNYSTAALQVGGTGNTTATGYLQGKFMMGTGTMGVAAGAAAGSSPTITCTTNHTCDGISGVVTLTTGTSPTTGTLATLNFPNTHTNQANCMVTTLSATAQITTTTWAESTTAITITANAALTASTAYTIKYWCGGY